MFMALPPRRRLHFQWSRSMNLFPILLMLWESHSVQHPVDGTEIQSRNSKHSRCRNTMRALEYMQTYTAFVVLAGGLALSKCSFSYPYFLYLFMRLMFFFHVCDKSVKDLFWSITSDLNNLCTRQAVHVDADKKFSCSTSLLLCH